MRSWKLRLLLALAIATPGAPVCVAASDGHESAVVACARDAGVNGIAAVDVVGGGLGRWWTAHSKTVIGVTECMLDGAALARLFVVGVSGVGGVLAAAALAVAATTCL